MLLMRGVITRWRRSAWRASILRALGAGCRLAVGSLGSVLCDSPVAQPTRRSKLIATAIGILQQHSGTAPVGLNLFSAHNIVFVSFQILSPM
ncbi:MAG: hypothetical protein EHM38_08500 [Geobacteraceae bacterium]|nr:MAG: hypothetical protein EHM38_08500 [Geobacteraceae bacterium]